MTGGFEQNVAVPWMSKKNNWKYQGWPEAHDERAEIQTSKALQPFISFFNVSFLETAGHEDPLVSLFPV